MCDLHVLKCVEIDVWSGIWSVFVNVWVQRPMDVHDAASLISTGRTIKITLRQGKGQNRMTALRSMTGGGCNSRPNLESARDDIKLLKTAVSVLRSENADGNSSGESTQAATLKCKMLTPSDSPGGRRHCRTAPSPAPRPRPRPAPDRRLRLRSASAQPGPGSALGSACLRRCHGDAACGRGAPHVWSLPRRSQRRGSAIGCAT